MYRQCDGYKEVHGIELAKFIHGKPILNGYQHSGQHAFNGAGCLAAGIVANFKDGIGSIYLEPVDATNLGQDYEYILTVNEDLKLSVKVISYGKTEFEGDTQQFIDWCGKPQDDSE